MKFINNSEKEYRIVQAAKTILQSKELESIAQYCAKQETCSKCIFDECEDHISSSFSICQALNIPFFADEYSKGKQEWVDECDAWLKKVEPKLRKKRRSTAKQNPVKRTLSSIFKRQDKAAKE